MEIKNVAWNVKQLIAMTNRNTIRFDYPIQRPGGQWNSLQKSYLIHSLAQDYPIPPVYFVGKEEEVTVVRKNVEKQEITNVRYVLDGNQRITTMKEFLEGGFALDADTPDTTIDGEEYEIAGMLFEELPEEVQDMIHSRTILTYTLDGNVVDDDEIEDLFYRMNNGSALTPQQKAKALMGVEWADRLNKVSEHVLIQEIAAFTKTQFRSDGHQSAIVQTMMMMDDSFDYQNVSSNTLLSYAETFKADSDKKEALLQEIEKACDYLVECFDKKETLLLKKIHFPMTVITAIHAMDIGVSPDNFAGWAYDFKCAFKPKKNESHTIPTNYAQFTGAGSTKKKMADGRRDEMVRHMKLLCKPRVSN